jgi:hypothetical protein
VPHAFFQNHHGVEIILAIDTAELLFGLPQQGTAIFSLTEPERYAVSRRCATKGAWRSVALK